MKKIGSILMAFTLLFVFAACSNNINSVQRAGHTPAPYIKETD